MNAFLAFFRLIRTPNLLIIILTQYLMRYCVIEPMFPSDAMELQMSDLQFFLLVSSTVLIAAAGYIINDYFDLKIDRINKPTKIMVGRYIERRTAMTAHVILNFVGLAIAAWISYQIGHLTFVTIHFLSAIGLWYYSTQFKNQLIIGNLVIAVLAGLVPLVVGIYEIPLLIQANADLILEHGPIFNMTFFWIAGYAFFAFFMTLAREITKDIIDIRGDKAFNSNTIPVTLGIQGTKYIIIGLYLFTIAALLHVQHQWLHQMEKLFFVTYALVLILLFNSFMVYRAKTKKQFRFSSDLNKLASVLGILSAGVVYYIIRFDFGA